MTQEEIPLQAKHPKHPRPRTHRDAVIIIILALASFAVGFVLVHLTLPKSVRPTKAGPSPQCAESTIPKKTEKTESNANGGDNPADATPDPGLQVAQVPPGPTPEGIRIEGAPLYYKCWDDNNQVQKECGRLPVFEKRMANRLYVVAKCREQFAAKSLGNLSLGVDIDFKNARAGFWSGPSSSLARASMVGSCVREKLAGIPLSSIDHTNNRYRLFFTISFFDPVQFEKQIAARRQRGKPMVVVMDRVNVREAPVSGASLGRISSGNQVTLLKKDKEWCQVITPTGRDGWMICKALKMP